jgi:4-hydroxy-tetrahydrodipicolinate reductase
MAELAHHPPLRRAVLIGVTGRMGCALMHAAASTAQLIVTGAIASPGSVALGRDAGEIAGLSRMNLPVSSDLSRALGEADVAIDFSSATATAGNLVACRTAGKPLLLGTTGFDPALEAQIEATARDIPLLVAPNTSLGAAVLLDLARRAARALPESFDIDVLDLHHRTKRDAPSGTALALGAAAAGARPGSRPVGFATVRAGDLVGEHSVLFTGLGEDLSLTHRVRDRAVFAKGALAAAMWLIGQRPGRYAMTDFIADKTAT